MDWALTSMGGNIICDICFCSNRIGGGVKGLALLHGCIQRIPRPIVGTVHVSKQVFPSIDLILTRSGKIQTVDSGTACDSAVSIGQRFSVGKAVSTYLQVFSREAIPSDGCLHWTEGRFHRPSSMESSIGTHNKSRRECLAKRSEGQCIQTRQ